MSTTMDTSSVRIIYGRKIWYGTCSWTARERYRLHPLRSNRIPGKEPSEIFSSSTASSPRRGGLHCEYLLPSMSFFSLSLFSFASFFFLCCILWQLSFSLNRRVVQQQQKKRRKKKQVQLFNYQLNWCCLSSNSNEMQWKRKELILFFASSLDIQFSVPA